MYAAYCKVKWLEVSDVIFQEATSSSELSYTRANNKPYFRK